MTKVTSSDDASPSQRDEGEYQMTVAIFNKATNKWEPGFQEVGTNIVKYIKESGGLEIFAKAQPGQTIAITESGIYLKSDEGSLTDALTDKEKKEALPTIKLIMQNLAKRIKPLGVEDSSKMEGKIPGELIRSLISKEPPASISIEVKIERPQPRDLTGIKEAIENTHPSMAQDIESKEAQLKDKMDEESSAIQSHRRQAKQAQIGEEIGKLKKELDVMSEAAHTASFAESFISALPPPVKVGEGKVKEVFVSRGSAYMRPIQSIMERLTGFREAELKREVATAKSIKLNLYRNGLIGFLTTKGVRNGEQAANLIIKEYPTAQSLLSALTELKSEITKELGINKFIGEEAFRAFKDEIPSILEKEANLAIEMEEVKGDEQLGEAYTVKSEAAIGDLEKFTTTQNVPIETKMGLIKDLVGGAAALHESGHVHGDLKLENVLVYEKTDTTGKKSFLLKLADWGKTRLIKFGERLMYKGNPRFAPPEKKLSKEGEVYSVGLMMIRILEEGLLPSTLMIKSPQETDPQLQPNPERRGLERFAILSKRMTQTESNLRGKVIAYGPAILAPTVDLDEAQKELYSYIDALTKKLEDLGQVSNDLSKKLNSLLKKMTSSKEGDRGTLREAYEEIERWFPA